MRLRIAKLAHRRAEETAMDPWKNFRLRFDLVAGTMRGDAAAR